MAWRNVNAQVGLRCSLSVLRRTICIDYEQSRFYNIYYYLLVFHPYQQKIEYEVVGDIHRIITRGGAQNRRKELNVYLCHISKDTCDVGAKKKRMFEIVASYQAKLLII